MALFRMKPHYRKRGGISYKGDPISLCYGARYLAATSIGDYALFGGGVYGNDTYNRTVTAINKSLVVQQTTEGLQWEVASLAATSVGNYALFGGGFNNSVGSSEKVTAYDASLTRILCSNLYSSDNAEATSVGNYAIIHAMYSSDVTVYDTSLTKSRGAVFQTNRTDLAATSVGNYALFGGGRNISGYMQGYTDVDVYNAQLTKCSMCYLTLSRYGLAATSVGDYALFGGGSDPNSLNTVVRVDGFNSSLTRITAPDLTNDIADNAATSIKDYAIFGGGRYGEVDAFDKSLVKELLPNLTRSDDRAGLAATSIGNYALFGGGGGSQYFSRSDVDVYQVT